jgi:hypothetical protein
MTELDTRYADEGPAEDEGDVLSVCFAKDLVSG